MAEPLFAAFEGDPPNLLEQDTEISELRRDADARRDAFFARMEGHSVAYIVEHSLTMARDTAISIMGESAVVVGDGKKVIASLIDRIENAINAIGDMARETHPYLRPDEHEPGCELRGPKEDN